MLENYFGLIIAAAILLIFSTLSFAAGSQAKSQTNTLSEKTKAKSFTPVSYSQPQKAAPQESRVSPTKAEIELITRRTVEFLGMILHDKKVFNRLVDYELKRNPKLSYADAIQEAIDRLRDDIRRN